MPAGATENCMRYANRGLLGAGLAGRAHLRVGYRAPGVSVGPDVDGQTEQARHRWP